jgi:hypothetical protein
MALFKSGTFNPIHPDVMDWVFLDSGFAGSSNKSSGLLLPGWKEGENLTWANACEEIARCYEKRARPLHLMIEAPLSMSFDNSGNPLGRVGEKRGAKARYWYMQGGLVVLTAAALLLQRLAVLHGPEIFLYEAFISFKKNKTDHKDDANLMRSFIANSKTPEFRTAIFHEAQMRPTNCGELISSTAKFGIDFGVPPIVFFDQIPNA